MLISAGAASGDDLFILIDQVLAQCVQGLGAKTTDLGMLFVTNHFEEDISSAIKKIRQDSQVKTLIGCTGEGVVGPQDEYERQPAVSLWMAHMPEVRIQPFHVTQLQLESANSETDWKKLFPIKENESSSLIFLGDPFTIPIETLLNGVNTYLPGCPVIGGMASGATMPGHSALILNDELYRDGGVGVAISGPVIVETVISQGCRPVGQPYLITEGEKNVITQLGGMPPLMVLNELYSSLTEEERALLDQGIFIGRVIDEYKTEFKRGDFLIRNVIGADQETGAIAVMDHVQVGTTIQFHVRDARTADEDLRHLLDSHVNNNTAGALLFSCNGRGTRMYENPNHDLNILLENLGKLPVAGFFCAGELGPVGGQNFIHGHTASIAIFREA